MSLLLKFLSGFIEEFNLFKHEAQRSEMRGPETAVCVDVCERNACNNVWTECFSLFREFIHGLQRCKATAQKKNRYRLTADIANYDS